MRRIEVVPYDKNWQLLFEQEATRVKQALGENCIQVHHVGSTSVPGLAAKPVIDMIPVVKDIARVDQSNEAMKALGYEPQGEFGIPFRRYFQKGGDERTHHVHVFEVGSPEVARHLAFRDWMRTHEDDKNMYAELKQNLAQQFPYDSLGYCNGKDAFIASIDAQASPSLPPRLLFVCTHREWEEYHQLNAQLFEDLPDIVYDRNYPTFTSPKHFNFVLYVGTKIVCSAQLERLNEQEFALRFLITKADERRKGYGSACVGFLERWMLQQGCKLVRLHAAAEAEQFYRELGYTDMEFVGDQSIDAHAIDLGKKLEV